MRRSDEWERRCPGVVRAIDQENKGHGGAVNTGLENACGLYFKVVDSDDWLDESALGQVMDYLRTQMADSDPTDMVIANYVYEKVHEGTHKTMSYKNVFPQFREFGWKDTHSFRQSQYILMHSIIYRTQLLGDCGLKLPEHCFYVDNIFVYVPLPHVRTMYYLPVDLYRYFIGREDQSVNESVMLARIDQQIKVTRCMIDAVRSAGPEHRCEGREVHGKLSFHDDDHLQHLPPHEEGRPHGRSEAFEPMGVPGEHASRAVPHRAASTHERSREPSHEIRQESRQHRLSRGAEDLQVQLMAHVPACSISAAAFE